MEKYWIDVDEKLPPNDKFVLVSFSNCSVPDIARYEEDENGGAFYPGDDDKSYVSYGLFVNAWMPLPKQYEKVEKSIETNILGNRIAELLKSRNLTQRELAKMVDVTEVSLSRYIKGARIPKGPVIANIATALHTTTDYLLGKKETPYLQEGN